MVPKEYLIIGGCNAVFIIINIILIFVATSEINAIISIIWCLCNAILALYFLKSNSNITKRDYTQSKTTDEIINEDEVQIFVDEDGNDTTTNTDIEMASTQSIGKLTQKYEKENKQRRQLEYENKQILEEYEKYKKENADTARDNLALIQQCKLYKTEIEQLKATNAQMMQQLEDGKKLQNDLGAMKANSAIISKQIEEYEQRISELQQKEQILEDVEMENQKLRQSVSEYKQEIRKLSVTKPPEPAVDMTPTISVINDQVDKLKQELAIAQKTIIQMQSVTGVHQKFPTTQETVAQFRSVRDQKHHDIMQKLKKFIKANGNKKWQKYFINQVVHEIMFEILIKCYSMTHEYRLKIYDEISDSLNMKHAIADGLDIKTSAMWQENNLKIIKEQQIRLLSNIFGVYFKNNFHYVLEKKLKNDDHKNKNENDEEKKNDGSYNNMVDNVLDYVIDRYSQYLGTIKENEEQYEGLKEYAVECCRVCWVMILQDPPLTIEPSKWRYGNDEKFDEKVHKRVMGSDKNCKELLYAVWPTVARNDIVLGDQKVDVVLRNELYTEFKQKHKNSDV